VAIGRQDVIDRWRALAAVTAAGEWSAALTDAAAQVSPDAWGSRADLATIHLAAHLLFVDHPELVAVGPVTSESALGVSRTYAASASAGAGDYGRSQAGREYLRLRRQLGLSISVI
jgi:Protein of unknown function (DUF4054)